MKPGQIFIIVFCLFHMAAVALYLLRERTPLRSLAVPYVLSFSQWQKWDIFSPDPLRRVSSYRLEREGENGWDIVAIADYEHLPWWGRAKELKILGRLEENWRSLATSYLESLCTDLSGYTVRLVASSVTLPKELHDLTKYAGQTPAPMDRVLGSASCP